MARRRSGTLKKGHVGNLLAPLVICGAAYIYRHTQPDPGTQQGLCGHVGTLTPVPLCVS